MEIMVKTDLPKEGLKSYVIVAPRYSGSAGVRVLYALRSELENRGFDAKIFCSSALEKDKKIFISSLSPKNRKNDIVVYPEVIVGNPLLFRNVVRYMLNKPGVLGGEKVFHCGETLFSFDRYCHPTTPMLRFDMLDRKMFFDANLPKDINCSFVYKGGKFREIEELKGCVNITSSYPKTRRELSELLQRTDTLYSYDNNSCLLQEAVLCGAKVKVITPTDIEDYKMNDEYNEEAFEGQIKHFIELTQAINYIGSINRTGYHSLSQLLGLYLQYRGYKILYLFTHKQIFKNKANQIKKSIQFTFRRKIFCLTFTKTKEF